MKLAPLPRSAAWTHTGVRTGFEVLFVDGLDSGHRFRAQTTANEAGCSWSVSYRVDLDSRWRTRRVDATGSTVEGERTVGLSCTDGQWVVDAVPRPDLDGCVDVDLESSCVTNTLPLHRLAFGRGEPVEVPAAFVRADDLRVERLEQRYTFVGLTDEGPEFHYEAPTFGFECRLRYDRSGLVVDYPGIAIRTR